MLGWWSLFNLPREALPGVLRTFAEALVPGGQALVGTHVGDGTPCGPRGTAALPSWTPPLPPEKLAVPHDDLEVSPAALPLVAAPAGAAAARRPA